MTMPTRLRPFRLALAPLLVLGLSAPVAFAQEEDETIQPRPSEMAPKSAQALLTAIASAGDRLVAVEFKSNFQRSLGAVPIDDHGNAGFTQIFVELVGHPGAGRIGVDGDLQGLRKSARQQHQGQRYNQA